MKNFILGIVFFGIGLFSLHSFSQGITKKSVDSIIKNAPAFSIHKDNYFISGVPLNEDINKSTADAKYQISFKQLITRNTLPFDTYLFLTYTQTSFWNIYENSSPFQEINFNPSIGLGMPIYNKNQRLTGLASIMLEHESNGLDSISSRSWNSVNLKYSTTIGSNIVLSVEAWIPYLYKTDNPDLFEYLGPGEINMEYDFIPKKITAEFMLRKGLKWDWKGAYRARVFYRAFNTPNLYFMLEWFNGYSESLINYKKNINMVRIGFVIKTNDLNLLKNR